MNITYQEYLNKVYGGWFGKCLGGAAGAPVEGIKSDIKVTMRDILDPTLPNDDLDIQLLWLEKLEQKGPYLSGEDLAQGWLEQCWYPFCEYGIFLKNYMRGVLPPESGRFNNTYFHEGMGCPIRSEIWALVAPGDVQRAMKLAEMDGTLDHVGNSVYAEMFLAAVESMAFYESDMLTLVETALGHIPPSRFRDVAHLVLSAYKGGVSVADVIEAIQLDYSHPDFTNSVQNLGYTIMALLYGGTDMEKTINLALACGYDTDCTCASAASVVGIIKGYDGIEEELRELLQDRFVCGVDVVRRDDTIRSLAEDTCRVGISLPNEVMTVTDIPADVTAIVYPEPAKAVTMTVAYQTEPAIRPGGNCPVCVTVCNGTDRQQTLALSVENLPAEWAAALSADSITLPAGESATVDVLITAGDVSEMAQTNLLQMTARTEEAVYTRSFGVVGSVIYKVVGPFYEPLESDEGRWLPPCHGSVDCVLPNVEAIFSNQALPQRPYLDEQKFADNAEAFATRRYVYATDDFIPIDRNFGLTGEAVFYAATDIVMEEDTECFAVVGNSDAFTMWINGKLLLNKEEIRLWQPQAHGVLVKLHKGANRVVFKICRRGESVKLSFALRGYEGMHFHRRKWLVNYASKQVK